MSDKKYDQELEGFDVVIVGGGMGGGILANELSLKGKRVLILEAGVNTSRTLEGYQSYVENYLGAAAKVPNSPYPENPNAPSPSVLDNHNIEILKDREGKPKKDKNGKPKTIPDTSGYWVQKGPDPFCSNYLRQLGGTMLHWLGLTPRMLPSDFHMKKLYDVKIDYDWPLTYTDLKPDYRRAEREIGVAGDVEVQKKLVQRFGSLLAAESNAPPEVLDECQNYFDEGYVYPMQEVPSSFVDQAFAKGVKGGVTDVETPVEIVNLPAGRNSTPNRHYDDGNGFTPVGATGDSNLGQRCEGNSSCIPICPVQAKYSALRTLDKALGRDCVTLVGQAVASRILIDPDTGNITGIEFKRYPTSGPGKVSIAQGKVYVLAAHAVENAKLLLASGAARTSGEVGRNLMDHPYFLTWGLMPESVGAFRGPGTTSGIPSFRDGPFRRKRAAFRTDISNWGWNFAAGAPDTTVAQLVKDGWFGSRLREEIGHTVPRQVRLGFLMEQLPNSKNRVRIDPRRYRDALGEPRPVIEYHLDKYTMRGIVEAKRISDAIFAQLGIEQHSEYGTDRSGGYVEYQGTGFNYAGSGHLVGTHRMGRSADDSVVNTDMRAWDHPNLYVVGCGSMPTIGTSNPTLTMTALTYRAARRILKDLGG